MNTFYFELLRLLQCPERVVEYKKKREKNYLSGFDKFIWYGKVDIKINIIADFVLIFTKLQVW